MDLILESTHVSRKSNEFSSSLVLQQKQPIGIKEKFRRSVRDINRFILEIQAENIGIFSLLRYYIALSRGIHTGVSFIRMLRASTAKE